MKRRTAISLITILLASTSLSVASGQTPVPQNPDPGFRQGRLTSTIDGIEIPHELLEYVQYFFEGHAVTKAERITRNGQGLYRLRVDRDDVPSDYSSFLLVFDLEWKFLNFEKQAPPPAPKPEPPKNEDKQPKPETENRGQGNDDREEEREEDSSGSEVDSENQGDSEEEASAGEETGSTEVVEPAG